MLLLSSETVNGKIVTASAAVSGHRLGYIQGIIEAENRRSFSWRQYTHGRTTATDINLYNFSIILLIAVLQLLTAVGTNHSIGLHSRNQYGFRLLYSRFPAALAKSHHYLKLHRAAAGVLQLDELGAYLGLGGGSGDGIAVAKKKFSIQHRSVQPMLPNSLQSILLSYINIVKGEILQPAVRASSIYLVVLKYTVYRFVQARAVRTDPVSPIVLLNIVIFLVSKALQELLIAVVVAGIEVLTVAHKAPAEEDVYRIQTIQFDHQRRGLALLGNSLPQPHPAEICNLGGRCGQAAGVGNPNPLGQGLLLLRGVPVLTRPISMPYTAIE